MSAKKIELVVRSKLINVLHVVIIIVQQPKKFLILSAVSCLISKHDQCAREAQMGTRLGANVPVTIYLGHCVLKYEVTF